MKLRDNSPTIHSEITALEAAETRGSFLGSLILSTFILICGIGFLAIGILTRSGIGLIWDLLGILTSGIGIYTFFELFRNFNPGNLLPAKGYIDHLRELNESKVALESKIMSLQALVSRQNQLQSERSSNRVKLLNAAIENRRLKVNLIEETEFIIKSKRKISKLESLAQQLSSGKQIRKTEAEIEKSFKEFSRWIKAAPNCRSSAGKRIYDALEEAMTLHSDIMEQIEDRLVLRAIDDDSDTDEAFTLDQVHSFLEKTSLQGTINVMDMKEAMTADEEYLKINAQLRLLKDGLKYNLEDEVNLDLDPSEDD